MEISTNLIDLLRQSNVRHLEMFKEGLTTIVYINKDYSNAIKYDTFTGKLIKEVKEND